MNATHERRQPETIGQIFAAWMATVDGCDCGNTQPPDACIPSTTPGHEYRCHYRCGDCGNTWTRAYPPRKEAVA